ncbi:hypothetical protein NW754_015839 [Fusarium falciforme]|nr:hypothetical protein NW754_015839 [Fusarium falciforme]
MTAAKYAFTKSLREVRFLFCQTSEQSAAVRSFITRAYPTMKRSNPNIPILIREARRHPAQGLRPIQCVWDNRQTKNPC